MNVRTGLFIFFLLAVLVRAAQPASAKAEMEPLELQLMLAEKVTSLSLPPDCGLMATDQAVRFKVLKVLQGFYLKKTVLVHIKCLREAVRNGTIADHLLYIYKLEKVPQPPNDTSEETYNIVPF